MKYYYVRRFVKGEDKGVIELPEKDYESTMRSNPEWKFLYTVGDTVSEEVSKPEIKPDESKSDDFKCPICRRTFKSERSLKIHKGRMHQ